MIAQEKTKRPRKRANATEASATKSPHEGTEPMAKQKVAPETKAHNPAPEADRFVVGELVGQGPDAHRDVTLYRNGIEHSLVQWTAAGDEARVRDIEAAKRLHLKQPRNIRKVIEHIWPAENQRPYVRTSRVRTSMPNGGTREIEQKEYWLTEREFLKLCARSETKIADAILEQMIDVFMAVRRGLMPAMSDEQARRIQREADDREFRTHSSRRKELGRLTSEAAALIVQRTGAHFETVRGQVLQHALGKACYGGSGRELAHISLSQFRDARACLLSLPGVIMVVPKRRARKLIASARAANDNASPAQPPLPFALAFEAGDVLVTLSAQKKTAKVST